MAAQQDGARTLGWSPQDREAIIAAFIGKRAVAAH
jgi:hypothetical protein